MISIIIPFRDSTSFIRKCVFSILERTICTNFEILLVNNKSKESQTDFFLMEMRGNNRIKILNYNKPSNLSAMNNFAAGHANGEFLLFLSGDTEVISPDWLEKMLKCFGDENVGAVGARLLYPNKTVKHNGVMLSDDELTIHAFKTWKEKEIEIDDQKQWSAITGACMMTRKDLFLMLGCFDKVNLPMRYADIDYCLRLRDYGKKIILISNVKLYRFESASQADDDMLIKSVARNREERSAKEKAYIRERWNMEIKNDPYYREEFIKK